MVGSLKVIKIRANLVNTYKLIKKGRLKKKDWSAIIEKLENQSLIFYPIPKGTKDREGVTLMLVNEVTEGDKVRVRSAIVTVKIAEHIEIEKVVEADQGAATVEGTVAADVETATNNNQTKHAILILSKVIAVDVTTAGIPAEVTFYDHLGITEEEVEQMKGELA